jgi:hypothetical protein
VATQVDLEAAVRELAEENERLYAELRLREQQERAAEWKRTQDRFHAFDGIRNDSCPCCGGPVTVIEDHNSVTLRARR